MMSEMNTNQKTATTTKYTHLSGCNQSDDINKPADVGYILLSLEDSSRRLFEDNQGRVERSLFAL
jgi:hypothetical protein